MLHVISQFATIEQKKVENSRSTHNPKKDEIIASSLKEKMISSFFLVITAQEFEQFILMFH
jgi:hypothetical protein